MTEPLNRDEVIDLLNKLGGDRDEEVLEAARRADALVKDAGQTWEHLLAPEDVVGEAEDSAGDEDDEDEDEDEDDEDLAAEVAEAPVDTTKKNAQTLALIEKLLARPGISDDFREELTGYKTDIAEGEFEDADHHYIRAVHKRLSKQR
jgi:hypothetical protein